MSALPVLYSFRRCPYAMRARLALAVSGQACELREVVLRNKPQGLLQASPKATVPVLVLVDGKVLDQSLAIMQWALAQHDPDDWLLQGDPAVLALIDENDQVFKHHLNRYKYAERYPEQPMEHYRAEGEVFLQKLEGLLAEREYLLAEHLSLADAALAPFVRQFAHVDREWFAGTPYQRLQIWLQRFLESPLFTAVMAKP